MKREILLHNGHGLPDAVMHDVEHVDANRKTGAGAAGAKAVARPGFACGGGVAEQRKKLLEQMSMMDDSHFRESEDMDQ
jgi:hypothetical protein